MYGVIHLWVKNKQKVVLFACEFEQRLALGLHIHTCHQTFPFPRTGTFGRVRLYWYFRNKLLKRSCMYAMFSRW